MKFSKQLRKIIFKLDEVFKSQNFISGKPTQVKWCCLTFVQPYGANPLRRLSIQKLSTSLKII